MRRMGKYDWYQATTWSAEAEKEFETRIKRQREWRPQYMVVQGRTLVASEIEADRDVGRALLRRVIAEYGESTEFQPRTEVAQAWGVLAMSLHSEGKTEDALTAFDALHLALSAAPEVVGIRYVLAHVDLLLELGDEASTDEAFVVLDNLERSFDFRTFPSDRYGATLRKARLFARRGEVAAAAEQAQVALELSLQVMTPIALRYPAIGTLTPADDDLAEMRALVRRRTRE
jgi:hypothetical protein